MSLDDVGDDEVVEVAREQGFEIIERQVNGRWCVGWARGGDERWPCFLEERLAVSWMRDRIRRQGVFV